MPRHGKNYTNVNKLVDPIKVYPPLEALALVKQATYTKFDATVEVHMNMGLDQRHADQNLRGVALLPAGTGKTVRVLVFAQGDKAREAEEAGADFVGADDLVKRIQEGWLGFDVAVATPDLMGKISGPLGRILGPRGLMPNPRTGTVSMDLAKVIKDVRAGRVEFRLEKTNLVHAPIGKVSFTDDQLRQNLVAFIDAILKAKPAGAKGTYVNGISICSTMGPGIKLEVQSTLSLVAA